MHDTIPQAQLEELRDHLKQIPVGIVANTERAEVLRLLKKIWERLPGASAESTAAGKLRRAEDLRWEPPNLCFVLERHGHTVFGSKQASLHEWVVNLESGQASLAARRNRQLYPVAKRFDANAVADEIASLIVKRSEDPRLKWLEDMTVQVMLSKATPSDIKQTQAARSKRLRKALTAKLSASGWNALPGSRCLFERRLAE